MTVILYNRGSGFLSVRTSQGGQYGILADKYRYIDPLPRHVTASILTPNMTVVLVTALLPPCSWKSIVWK